MTTEANTIGPLGRLLRHQLVRQFLQFATIGAGVTAIHYAILIALVELAGFDPVVATSIGAAVGATTSYVINRYVTFAERPPFARALLKFLGLAAIGLLINAAIMGGLRHLGMPYILAQCCATVIVLMWNFGTARFLVFRT